MFNEQQIKAITDDSSHILCIAGAGSGKTTVLLERVGRLIDKEHVNPSSILCITFTNAAANEMKIRFENRYPGYKCPEFRTFHSFCYALIVSDPLIRSAIGYSQIPGVPTDTEYKRIQKHVQLQLKITLTEDKISGKDTNLTKKEKEQLDMLNKGIKRMLKQENYITFDIMCYEVSDLFVKNDVSTQPYKQKYKYLFADEFQDTDIRQIKFLGSFTGANFFCVGDAQQNIYSWRGTTNEPLKTFAKDPHWKVIKLYDNYRSSNQIVQFANRIISYADASYRIDMKAHFDGEQVDVQYGACSSFSAPVDGGHIKDLILKLPRYKGTTAVLCRTNREVKYLCTELKAAGVEYKHNDPEDLTKQILQCTLDDKYMLSWLGGLLPAERYADFIRLSAIEENPDIHWFAKTFDVPEVKRYGKLIVAVRKSIKKDLSKKELPAVIISNILDVLGKPNLKDEIDLSEVSNLQSIDEIIQYMIKMMDTNPDISCYVGTIHSVKGLEFDNVYVMGVNDYLFKLECEEDKNIYYVAVTRAKNHLTVYRR